MKKQILILATALLSLNSFAQNNVMNEGDLMFNIGIGFGTDVTGSGGYYTPTVISGMPSIQISGEKGMFPTGDVGIVTLGGSLGAGFSKSTYTGNTDFKTVILFRGAWHLSVLESKVWDVYAGAGLGVAFGSKDQYDNYSFKHSGYVIPGYSAFVGGRWMMSDDFGFFGEVGGGTLSFIRAGVTFRL